MSSILMLEGAIKDYAWGNDYYLSDLLGLTKDGPRAELWMGAHSQGSAIVEGPGEKLCDLLDRDPEFCNCTSSSFPFLFKVLAIAQSLSIQCHPDSMQAKEGFENEAEVRQTLPRSQWNYQDSNQKAEMLYALTPVQAMCGFRTFEEACSLLKKATPIFFEDSLKSCTSIYSLFDTIYRTDSTAMEYAQAELLRNMEALPELESTIIRDLGDRYFGDPGVFCPLLLNIVTLSPGQAIYLKPRVLHAYISGNGIELMNNSDNVLRAGLTKKHMDLDELEKVMIKDSYDAAVMRSVTDNGGVHFVCEGGFTLTVMKQGTFTNAIAGPRILLCTEGTVTLNSSFVLTKGQCCIVGSETKELTVEAQEGTVFMASAN